MKKNAFTLIELIGVITIMCLILIIVLPSTSKLLKQNTEKKYKYYYEIVEDAALSYASTREDDLGSINGNGCIDITLNDLIKEKYIKKFDDSETVCSNPYDDVNTDIRIRNNKGKITTEISLVCTKNGKKVFEKLIKKSGTCSSYVATIENVLIDKLTKDLTFENDGNTKFVTAGNNYVWYSGKLWRVVSVNTLDKTIKLVTDDVVSVATYNSNASSNYNESNIYSWLVNEFLPTLKTPENFLFNATWDYTMMENGNKPNNGSVARNRIGLLNYYEYSKTANMLNISKNWWLLTPYNSTNSWYVNNSNSVVNINTMSFFGIRPAIVLKANTNYFSGGDGTTSNPYRLVGDAKPSTGVLLNSRFSGEYVNFDGSLFRIVTTKDGMTKLISDSNIAIGKLNYDSRNYVYNEALVIGEYLNKTWYNEISSNYKNMLVVGDFCTEAVTNASTLTSKCSNLRDIRAMKVGLPKLGDLYTTSSNDEYWTLNRTNELNINVVGQNASVEERDFTTTSGVKPVIYIDSDVKIVSGEGSSSKPFVIKK